MTPWRRLLGPVALAVALAGCTAGPESPVTASPGPSPGRLADPGLFAVDSRVLGPIVIDGQGYVLYRFDGDSSAPPRSNCVDECTARWLPVLVHGELRVVGIDRQLVGNLARADGTVQLTLGGWPLYGFAGDRMPGDTNGQDHAQGWWVIAPNGGKAARAGGPAD
ncbi:hypothetical protein [Longispora fulva]|uniref:Putative lipoprotein with Yx(FWY)xxD motif n=1 Tax=Longispora fulva TaxID=619741 RepID=A0A8J7GFH5_9ACTN|nr:hypothetical protein [Longispora fulva]MBG6134963.1 putative lipoprotein with Yx(FWY)xxD motif [Longispora fulva]